MSAARAVPFPALGACTSITLRPSDPDRFHLGHRLSAKHHHICEQRDQLLEGDQGLWARSRAGWVLNDIGEGSIEIRNQQNLGWLYSCDRRLFPGMRDLFGFLNHPSPYKRGRCRSITDFRSWPFGKTPNICPHSPSSREAQKSSAAAGSPKRSINEASSATAIRSTRPRARNSMASGSAISCVNLSSARCKRESWGAESTSSKYAASESGSCCMARNTSSALTLPEPSQMEFSGASR